PAVLPLCPTFRQTNPFFILVSQRFPEVGVDSSLEPSIFVCVPWPQGASIAVSLCGMAGGILQ
ncbi:MAG TPA: hypothetical protein PLB18_07925, partial [Acidobacteriota bacterium]|nr:hypothetical protein [Acidobacteriota bacterium]